MYIYRLHINNTTIYIGKCKNIKRRYGQHKSDCFNEKSCYYNQYKYLCVRQIGIIKDNFKDYVKIEILYEQIPKMYEKKMEELTINLYTENGSNLWNDRKADFDRKHYDKEYQNTDKRKEFMNKY